MKKNFILAFVCVWMYSCNSEPQVGNADTQKADTPKVDTTTVKSADTLTTKVDTVISDPTYSASFKVLYTTSYCGGARPTEEITAEHEKARLLTTSTLRLVNHHTGKEYLLITSPAGEASATMEEGKYDVYFTKEINPNLPTGFDAKCNVWLQKVILTVKVTSSGKMQDMILHFECNPCDSEVKMRP